MTTKQESQKLVCIVYQASNDTYLIKSADNKIIGEHETANIAKQNALTAGYTVFELVTGKEKS